MLQLVVGNFFVEAIHLVRIITHLFKHSLFLAGKVEETPKKCKDIIKVAKASLSEAQFQQFGEDAKVSTIFLAWMIYS